MLGHGTAAFTFTTYGHVFPSDLDALGEALGATWDQASRDVDVTNLDAARAARAARAADSDLRVL